MEVTVETVYGGETIILLYNIRSEKRRVGCSELETVSLTLNEALTAI
jgi:hypothetical protein